MSLSPASPRPGVAHLYAEKLVAFEHGPSAISQQAPNLIIFIGGLGDGLLTLPYPTTIADSLPPSWSFAEAIITSSYTGWGSGSLLQDASELSKCVSYFRGIKTGKIIIMGHSTGSQDVMEYLAGVGHENRAPIEGAIIQAPASDREAFEDVVGTQAYHELNAIAQKMMDSGDGEEVMSMKGHKEIFPDHITARRWLSFASPNHDGDDDYFSQDLTDEQLMKTFGSLPARTPLCILISEKDEYMPHTDKRKLYERWVEIANRGAGMVDEENSGLVEGASHNLREDSEEVVRGLARRVVGFAEGLEK